MDAFCRDSRDSDSTVTAVAENDRRGGAAVAVAGMSMAQTSTGQPYRRARRGDHGIAASRRRTWRQRCPGCVQVRNAGHPPERRPGRYTVIPDITGQL